MEKEKSTVHNCIEFHLEAKDPTAEEEVDFDHITLQLIQFQGELATQILVWSSL